MLRVKKVEKEVFQSPKGRLQTCNSQRGCSVNRIVSIPKGEATNSLRVVRQRYQLSCFNPQRGGYKQREGEGKGVGNEVSIPKGEATNWENGTQKVIGKIVFQSPKGRLQTMEKTTFLIKSCGFQSPKGRLQTRTIKENNLNYCRFNPQRGGYKRVQTFNRTKHCRIVSIPKGEATNTFKSLILLYQDYTPLSMFLY